MADKNTLPLNDEQLENVLGGLSLSAFLTCSNEVDAANMLRLAGIKPGTTQYDHFMALWSRDNNSKVVLNTAGQTGVC